MPQTRSAGVVYINDGRLQRLRNPGRSGVTVVYEVRRRQVGPPIQAPPLLRAPTQRPPARASTPRTAKSSPATEWMNLGLNCGGAALAWVGVVGMSALIPATGGLTAFGAGFLYAGALAASGQCGVSAYRTTNVYTGRSAVNERLDNSNLYVWTMLAADGIGLLGAGGAFLEVKAAHKALSVSGFTWSQVARPGLSRPARRQLTTAFGLQGARRVPGPTINRYVRQKLLDGVAGAVGLTASATGGVIKEMVVWIVDSSDRGG